MTRKNRCGAQAGTQAANPACRTVSLILQRRDGLTRQTRRKCGPRFAFSFLVRPVTRFSLKGCTSREPTYDSSSKIRFMLAGGSIERSAILPPLGTSADLADVKAIAGRFNVRQMR